MIDGISEQEWTFLNKPLRDLSGEQKSIAIGISDKRANFIYEENCAQREEEKKLKQGE